MPTRRALAFIITATLLYFFANQTQVGWIYIMCAITTGVLIASWWLNRRTIRGISVDRTINPLNNELHEGDEVEIHLSLRNTHRSTASLIRAAEICPFAEDQKTLQLFVPSLSQNQTAQFDYTVIADRRGVHRFPPEKISSRAPFGFFERKREIDQPTPVLIYPEVKKLRRLDLLDRQPAAQIITPRAGIGTEVIGIRAYRVGDSPRHIHWRSVARTNHLVSKEFADETHPGLTLILDVQGHELVIPRSAQRDEESLRLPKRFISSLGMTKSETVVKPAKIEVNLKHSPFEYAVKIAASIGDYALRRNYPLHLLADDSSLAIPSGALNRIALLEYLARVQPDGQRTFKDVIHNRAMQSFVAIVMPYPDHAALESLSALSRRARVMVVLLDPSSFPNGGITARSLADDLRGLEIDVRLIRYGQDWQNSIMTNDNYPNVENPSFVISH